MLRQIVFGINRKIHKKLNSSKLLTKIMTTISENIIRVGRVIHGAFDASFNWVDIETCSICKAELIEGKCLNGHIIVR